MCIDGKNLAPRILLMENRDAPPGDLVQVLREEGFEPVVLAPAEQLDSLLKQEPFDTVLIALDRFDEEGTRLVRTIREIDAVLPVVFLTAEEPGLDPEAFASEGFTAIRESEGPQRLFAALWRGCHAQAARRAADLESRLTAQAELLLRSKAEMTEFAAICAHDLRSPLLTISGYCDFLRHEYQARLDDAADRYLQSIINAAARMNALIEDLSGYAKIRCEGKPVMTIDLAKVLSDALANLGCEIRESGATVEIDALPHVPGNPTQLVQLFQNLIDNAIKFRGPDRPVIRVSSTPESGGHTIRVSDNGMGIDREHHEIVFGIFQRLARSRELPGSGIGLAICKRVADCHGGRIWIESERDQGATLLIWLPGDGKNARREDTKSMF